MSILRSSLSKATFTSSLLLALVLSTPVSAHCDSMSGPVVKDAQSALESGTVDPILKWIGKEDEAAIREAFDMTLAVRGESDAARTIADTYFFETLVRVHRATEGEGFTGLKPAGNVDPAIAAADLALEEGDAAVLADETAASVRAGIIERFNDAYAKRQVADETVEQGRDYVDAYVEFTHFALQVNSLAEAGPSHQHSDADVAAHN